MDPSPPTFMASFTDAHETCICGRDTCRQAYRDCTPDEKALWKWLTNSRNTFEAVRWVCGTCAEYYHSKLTTQRRGAIKVLTTINVLTD
jgi:hypothetical protein